MISLARARAGQGADIHFARSSSHAGFGDGCGYGDGCGDGFGDGRGDGRDLSRYGDGRNLSGYGDGCGAGTGDGRNL
jgi:hypothetical protein